MATYPPKQRNSAAKQSTSLAKTIPPPEHGLSIKITIKVHALFPLFSSPGIIWKRLALPWTALEPEEKEADAPVKAVNKQLKKAEAYLRDAYPDAQIPQDLLKEHLSESIKDLDERAVNLTQGELLGLGITRITRYATGRKHPGRWHEFFVAFPTGKMKSHISTLLSCNESNY
jgi:hypothetical protein